MSSYPISYMTKFCSEESFWQKDSKILKTDQKFNNKSGVRPLYLSQILHWFYPIRYMANFRYGNVLLIGDFKNTNTKICAGNRRSDHYLLPGKVLPNWQLICPVRHGQFLVWKNLLKENFKCTKTYQNIRGEKMVRPLLF